MGLVVGPWGSFELFHNSHIVTQTIEIVVSIVLYNSEPMLGAASGARENCLREFFASAKKRTLTVDSPRIELGTGQCECPGMPFTYEPGEVDLMGLEPTTFTMPL